MIQYSKVLDWQAKARILLKDTQKCTDHGPAESTLEWANFLTANLKKRDKFQWAKDLFLFDAWKEISNLCNNPKMTFTLPQQCPVKEDLRYTTSITEISDDADNQVNSEAHVIEKMVEDVNTAEELQLTKISTPESGQHKRKRKTISTPIVASDVRRSGRLKEKLRGFRSVHYLDKNYLGFSSTPPTLSTKIIKDLGKQFYRIATEDLSAEALAQSTRGNKAKAWPSTSTEIEEVPARPKKTVAKKKASATVNKPANDDKSPKRNKK